MKRTIALTGLAALALGFLPSVQALGPAFVRPTIAYVSPDADGYDDAAYVGVAGGVAIGETRQHEFSGEIGGTGWDYDERIGGGRIKGTETYVPVLASYRYYFQPVGAKVRFFVSPSVGFTHAQYEIEVSAPGTFAKDDSTEVFATVAGSVGLDININERFSVNIGYRYLYIDGGETELLGADLDLEESKAHVAFASLNIRL